MSPPAPTALGRNRFHPRQGRTTVVAGNNSCRYTLDPSTPEGFESAKNHVSGNSRFGLDVIARLKIVFEFSIEQRPGGLAHRFGKLRAGIWGEYLDELRAELADVGARIESIVGGRQVAADAEVQELQSFYCLK